MHDTTRPAPTEAAAHRPIDPGILYFGTPVVLLSTLNEDGTANLAPFSSVFWLGRRAVLGIGARSTTARNLLRTRECVLNLPSDDLAPAVDRLALTTGTDPVPPGKARRGYRHVRDKFARAGLGRTPSATVAPPRVTECPVHMEGEVRAVHPVAEDDAAARGGVLAFEVLVTRVHVTDALRLPGTADRVDPDAWRPLIMSFQHFYGLGPRRGPSALATIPEDLYR
ncbi:flavin reductase family protein [Streptomyces avicenniae]|uniref:flavin reductase family protein n=1 Tax=Streptomyces avicenniae TaxID=500153 RepID=UPI00069A7964|nr:flavin reductase family protein [Streptomyces avicenniae]